MQNKNRPRKARDAEEARFELAVPLLTHLHSKQALSTAQPPFQNTRVVYNIFSVL